MAYSRSWTFLVPLILTLTETAQGVSLEQENTAEHSLQAAQVVIVLRSKTRSSQSYMDSGEHIDPEYVECQRQREGQKEGHDDGRVGEVSISR